MGKGKDTDSSKASALYVISITKITLATDSTQDIVLGRLLGEMTLMQKVQPVIYMMPHSDNPGASSSGIGSWRLMVVPKDNTLSALYDAARKSFKDRKSRNGTPSMQQSLQLRSGRRGGEEVDLSAIDEASWPACLEYFCQFTKSPDLTVEYSLN